MSEDLKTSLGEAAKFFSQAASHKKENDSEAQSNTTSLFSVNASDFFAAAKAHPQEKTEREKAREIERHQEFLRRMIQHKKDDLTKDIQGVMLNEYGCIAKDIVPTLSCDTVLRKKLAEFLSKYMAQIVQTNSEAYFALDNDEEIEKVIKRLKSSCVEIESVINSEYEKYFNSLYEDQDEELVLEAKRIEDATKAERDLLILQYKTLLLEYVVLLEKHREIVRNRPKF